MLTFVEAFKFKQPGEFEKSSILQSSNFDDESEEWIMIKEIINSLKIVLYIIFINHSVMK